MPAYSMDLRERIVAAYQAGEGSVRALAVRFAVTPRSVSRYLALVRDTGSVAPREGQKRGARAKIERRCVGCGKRTRTRPRRNSPRSCCRKRA
jgi:transposase-like protein